MPAGAYIATPATNAGDGTYLTTGLDRLGEMSPEKSFFARSQHQDLISQMKNARRNGQRLKTPRAGARDPLRQLPNGNQPKAEFTPLMKSATRNNMARRLSSRKLGAPETPAFLRDGYSINGATPALPKMADSHSELTGSSAGNANDFTPLPHNISSSAQSTPLAQFPGRDAGGVVNDGNMMTLREQENIIDKIEKENFGLKMKIHFLEEAMSKRGNEFNQAALKENTDLKVNRITMQRELHKFKKNVAQAERDAEVYRLQLDEYRERMKRRQADESVRIEIERMQTLLQEKEIEIERLQTKAESGSEKQSAELQTLQDDVEDLQAELRQKDQEIEQREDEIDALKMNASKESNIADELEDELETAKQQIEDLKNDLERAAEEAKAAKEEREEAAEEKRKAEGDLDELRDEMANKSFTTKGLSRQFEEKANKLENDFEELQERHASLQQDLEGKVQSERQLQEKVRELEKEGAADIRQLQHNLEIAQQQRDTAERKMSNTIKQLENAEHDLQVKTEEKDLLQTRHDTLTSESAGLQRDLEKTQKSVRELEDSLEEERQHAAQNENMLRMQQRNEADLFNEQIDSLHREVNAKDGELATLREDWDAQKCTLEATFKKAEEKANGLQRTVERLQDSQGTLSSREMKLQNALESENQRHLEEENVLGRQIAELNKDLAAKRSASDSSRTELSNAKEELRISIREQAALKEKVAELEEEIEVLQADIEEEHQFAEQQQKRSIEGAEGQILRIQKEKQSLQDQLNNANFELKAAKRATETAESERHHLEAKLHRTDRSADDTFNVDQEKRELRRTKQKLEKDVERMRTERDSLSLANKALEEDINSEIERANGEEHRLNTEIDLLRNKQITSVDIRDRELTSAKNKVTRFETRIRELEERLDHQSRLFESPDNDASGLKADLEEARKSAAAATKREAEMKGKTRDLKTQIIALERDLHEAQLAQFKSSIGSSTLPSSHSKELNQLRKQLVESQAELKHLREQQHGLRRGARSVSVDEAERADLHKLLKSSTLEAESLASELSQRERQIADLRSQLKRTRVDRDTQDLSLKLFAREKEAKEMKEQVKSLREERRIANQKAEAIENELDALQARFEAMLDKLASGQADKDQMREKEMKGLIKQVTWLKAKCKREERLREELAWSKEYMGQVEMMRQHCNQVDLRILREMGVSVEKRKYEKKLLPKQKFRAGVFAVMAVLRMSKLEEQWRDVRQMGEELKAMSVRSKLGNLKGRKREV